MRFFLLVKAGGGYDYIGVFDKEKPMGHLSSIGFCNSYLTKKLL